MAMWTTMEGEGSGKRVNMGTGHQCKHLGLLRPIYCQFYRLRNVSLLLLQYNWLLHSSLYFPLVVLSPTFPLSVSPLFDFSLYNSNIGPVHNGYVPLWQFIGPFFMSTHFPLFLTYHSRTGCLSLSHTRTHTFARKINSSTISAPCWWSLLSLGLC